MCAAHAFPLRKWSCESKSENGVEERRQCFSSPPTGVTSESVLPPPPGSTFLPRQVNNCRDYKTVKSEAQILESGNSSETRTRLNHAARKCRADGDLAAGGKPRRRCLALFPYKGGRENNVTACTRHSANRFVWVEPIAVPVPGVIR